MILGLEVGVGGGGGWLLEVHTSVLERREH